MQFKVYAAKVYAAEPLTKNIKGTPQRGTNLFFTNTLAPGL